MKTSSFPSFTFTFSSRGAVQQDLWKKMGYCPNQGVGGTDMDFLKSFTQVWFPNFSILSEKTGKSWHFWTKLKMEEVLLIHFEQIGKLSSQIQTHSSCFVKQANFTDNVISRVNSWKLYPSPKILYTSATCATCDKFHVCGGSFANPTCC